MNHKDALAERSVWQGFKRESLLYGLYLDVAKHMSRLRKNFVSEGLRKKSLIEYMGEIKPMIDDLMEHDYEVWLTICCREAILTSSELKSEYNKVVYDVISGMGRESCSFHDYIIRSLNDPRQPRMRHEWHESIVFDEEVNIG